MTGGAVVRAALVLVGVAASAAHAYPVTVESCGEQITFEAAPRRPIVNDSNMVQTVIDLGLAERFVGFGAVAQPLAADVLIGAPEVLSHIAAHQLSDRYPTMENILGADPDFYFAGWGFGFSQGTGVTPAALAAFRVPSYVLEESCIRVGARAPVSMETMYADVLVLGRIFGVEVGAEAIVADLRARVAAVTERTQNAAHRPRVLYCGNCDSDGPPLVIGAEGMPAALIALAGGENVYPEIADSYVRTSWETVVARDPDWILISNPRVPHEQLIRYLTTAPALRDVTAVKRRQFIFMAYPERSPSTRNVDALERLARALHPELLEP